MKARLEGVHMEQCGNDAVKKIDWVDWSNRGEVRLCEAVALACGIDPRSLAWDRFDNKFDNGAEYQRRLDIARSHAGRSLHLLDYGGDLSRSRVLLEVFVEWAEGVWSDLPAQLLGVGPRAEARRGSNVFGVQSPSGSGAGAEAGAGAQDLSHLILSDDFWSLWEAAYLLLGRMPTTEAQFEATDKITQGPVLDIYRSLKNAVTDDKLPVHDVDGTFQRSRVRPHHAVSWALRRGIDVPEFIRQRIKPAPSTPAPNADHQRLVTQPRFEPVDTITWVGGELAEAGLYTLEDASRLASQHAEKEITPREFLSAAESGAIALHAFVRRQAQLVALRAGDDLPRNNNGLPDGTIPRNAGVLLSQSACRSLAAAGRASWRSLEDVANFPEVHPLFPGQMYRFDRWALAAEEPDIETVLADCRVTGFSIKALADRYLKAVAASEPTDGQDGMDEENQGTLAQGNAGAPALEDSSRTEIDWQLLATRRALIDAFGSFTGMSMDWFNNLKDTPRLMAARKFTGRGGRGHYAEPLFCPFEVMVWLIDPKRRKRTERSLSQETGWRLLKAHFPKVYSEHSEMDPRAD